MHYKNSSFFRLICRLVTGVFFLSACVNPMQFGVRVQTLHWDWNNFSPDPAYADDVLDTGFPPQVGIARTVSPVTAAAVQNHRVTLTYTVFNPQKEPLNEVLLSTTLAAGVHVVESSKAADQSGQQLIWSLGSLAPFASSSVVLSLSLDYPLPAVLDDGAQVFANEQSRSFRSRTKPAALRSGSVDQTLLQSTIDADINDSYVLTKAGELNHDPEQIFDFVRDQIRFESYRGSLRGARGTLWSGAGNALDKASLLIALLRVSGIPARYATGTLDDAHARQLILSMFPPILRSGGVVPEGATQLSEPADDPQLLDEVREHYWVEFDADGNGFRAADPNFSTAQVGVSFTAVSATFAEIPDALRHKVTFRVNAELSAPSLFGGSYQSQSEVLHQTFNTVELVGRPVSLSHFVTANTLGSVFSTTTFHYVPYLLVDESDSHPENNRLVQGSGYDEVISNFPFGSQVLTGIFLELDAVSPDGNVRTSERTILDRLGYDIRRNGGTPQQPASSDRPAITEMDTYTVNVAVSATPDELLNRRRPLLAATIDQMNALQGITEKLQDPSYVPVTPDELAQNEQVAKLELRMLRTTAAIATERYLNLSDTTVRNLGAAYGARIYAGSPRFIIASHEATVDGTTLAVQTKLDLRKNDLRAVLRPNQLLGIIAQIHTSRGYLEDINETAALESITQSPVVSTTKVFLAAQEQNIPLTYIGTDNIDALDAYDISPTAKARISDAVGSGKLVQAPTAMVTLNGKQTIAWFEIDQTTFETVGVREDGLHFVAAAEWAIAHPFLSGAAFFAISGMAGALLGFFFTIGVGSLALLVFDKNAVADTADSMGDSMNPDKHNYFGMGAVGAANFGGGLALQAELEYWAYMVYRNVSAVLGSAIQPGTIAAGFMLGFTTGVLAGLNYLVGHIRSTDPAILPVVGERRNFADTSSADTVRSAPATLSAGNVIGAQASAFHRISGTIHFVWTGAGNTGFPLTKLMMNGATIVDENGVTVASGTATLSTSPAVEADVFSAGTISLDGSGALSFYTPDTSPLGMSADWNSFTAALSGGVMLSLETDSLQANGSTLPAGRYRLTAAAASISGSGAGSSANFLGSVAIAATQAAIETGQGSGALTVNGAAVPTANGYALTDFNGNAQLSAGNGSNTLNLDGSVAQVLYLTASAAALSTNQNTAVETQISVNSSAAGDYSLTARAPPGWTVSFGNGGAVSVQPAPGTQSGTYPLFVSAVSKTDPALIAAITVPVSVSGTTPGVSLNIESDPQFFVQFSGAHVPSVFQVTVVNLGPAADTFQFSLTGAPAGFSVESGPQTMTLPAGETGQFELSLRPDTFPLPPPGTLVQFTGNVVSLSDSSIHESKSVSWIVPEIHAVSLMLDPLEAAALPGGNTAVHLAVKVIGNVAEESLVLSKELPPQVSLSGLLSPLNLSSGEESLQTLTLSPDAALPLGSRLPIQIGLEYGPAGARQSAFAPLNLSVSVPGTEAAQQIQSLAYASGRADLAQTFARLGDLLAQLSRHPDDPFLQSQVAATLSALEAELDDPVYVDLVAALDAIRNLLTSDPATILSGLDSLPSIIGGIRDLLEGLSKHDFRIILLPNSALALPSVPAVFKVSLQNVGSRSTTFHLSLGSLPASVDSAISNDTITLSPGAVSELPVVSLVQNGDNIIPFGFTVTATVIDPDGGGLARSAQGSLIGRQESAQIFSAAAVPPFANSGIPVSVSARVIAALNSGRSLKVRYTVEDSSQAVVFTSSEVPVDFGVDSAIHDVVLPELDTTGLANGFYTIHIVLTEADGSPITGAETDTQLLIGTPFEASLSIDPEQVSPGDSTVQAVLHVKSAGGIGAGLQLLGSTPVSGASGDFAIKNNKVYIAGTSFGDIADISDPTHPFEVGTFGLGVPMTSLALGGGSGDRLVAAALVGQNTEIRTFDLADPLNPQLQTSSPLILENRQFLAGILPHGDRLYSLHTGLRYLLGVNDIYHHWGGVSLVDVGNISAPAFVGELYTAVKEDTINPAITIKGYGPGWAGAMIDVSDNVIYSPTTNSPPEDPGAGQGVIRIFDVSNPASPVLSQEMIIPGTAHVVSGMRQGNQVLLVCSTGGINDPAASQIFGSNLFFFRGNMLLTLLDVSDPLHPTIASQQNFPDLEVNFTTRPEPIGGGKWFLGEHLSKINPESDRAAGVFRPGLFGIVDTGQSPQIRIKTYPAFPGADSYKFAVRDDKLIIVAPSAGLLIYSLENPAEADIAASVEVPMGSGVSIIPNSFNVPPSEIDDNGVSQTLIWKTDDFPSAYEPFETTINWGLNVQSMHSVEARQVLSGGKIEFIYQNAPGQLNLNPVFVSSGLRLSLSPKSAIVQPGEPAHYTLSLTNPTNTGVVYILHVLGVPPSWVQIPDYVIVNPAEMPDVDLTITPDISAATTDYHFSVLAVPDGQNSDAGGSASGTLTITGDPVVRDIKPQAVVLKLIPQNAVAGRSNPARFTARIYNTGGAAETFALAGSAFGFHVSLSTPTVEILPGIGNYRDVTVEMLPDGGTTPGDYFLDVTAALASNPDISSTDSAEVKLVSQGVQLSFLPDSTVPNSSIQLHVRNTGQSVDTFRVALSGPVAPFASLGQDHVTVAAGMEALVPVTIGTVNNASPGYLPLIANAISQLNVDIKTSTVASVALPKTNGFQAKFSPSLQQLAAPGTASFLLTISNIGNLDGAFRAGISGTTNGAFAQLIGIDGRPAAQVPVFRVPGLTSGFLLMQARLPQAGEGRITVHVAQTDAGDSSSSEPATEELSSVDAVAVIRVNGAQNDLCPNDPAKTAPGICGCGTPDSDRNGNQIIDCVEQQPTCSGTCATSDPDRDEDNDGVDNCQEITDHTDPCDSGSHITQLQPFSCAGANGFLGQVDIATVLNHQSTPLAVNLEYRDLGGELRGHIAFTLPAFLKRDIIINDLGLLPDSYGTVCVFTDAHSSNAWSGGMTLYKQRTAGKTWNPDAEFDFALYYPFQSPQTGPSNWSLNTNTVGTDGLGTVANWLRIADAIAGDGNGVNGTLRYYDIDGNLLSMQEVRIPDGGRFDYAAHLALGAHKTGQVEFLPDDNRQEYYIEATRYFYEGVGASSDKFYTAFALPNRPLTGAAVTGRASVLPNQLGVVEMVNGSNDGLHARLEFFDRQGHLENVGGLYIQKKGSAHQIINSLNAFSDITSARVSGPPESIAATTVLYQLNESGQLQFAYAPPFTESSGALQLTEFNSFIHHDNTLELDNSTDRPMTANVQILDFNQTPLMKPFEIDLPPNGNARQRLTLPSDTYGTIAVDSGTDTGLIVRNEVSRPFQYILPFLGN
jgi:uncharacterized membrane protein